MIALCDRFVAGVRDGSTAPACRGRSPSSAPAPSPVRARPAAQRRRERGAARRRRSRTYLHLFLLNRGVLITPFHNMALMSPATTEADVDRHTDGLRRGSRSARLSRGRVRLPVTGAGRPTHR